MTHKPTTYPKHTGQITSPHHAEQQSKASTKAIYRVVATSTLRFAIYVEAESEAEALEIGDSVDGAHWTLEDEGSWDIDYAEPEPDASTECLLPEDAFNTL